MTHILLIDNRSRHGRAFAHQLERYGHVTRIPYLFLREEHIAAADIIVLSGGWPAVVYHHWFFGRQLKLIQSCGRPVVGICLGFELIAKAFGGHLHRLPRKTHGLRRVTLAPNALGLTIPEATLWESHRWSVQQAPDGFVELGRSTTGVELMQHQHRPIIGCQFHPEIISPANDGPKLLDAIMRQTLAATRPDGP